MLKPARLFVLGTCLAVLAACGSNDTDSPAASNADAPPPPPIAYELVNVYPHEVTAYTQGLTYYDGKLYEGTGQLGQSRIRITDVENGKVHQEKNNTDDIFGEGIAVLQGKIYQLTWQNGKVFVYNATTLEKEKEFPLTTEGWGLTTDGESLIVSDGTSFLYFYNPADFSLRHKVNVTDNMGPRVYINELEYINGYVYANLYQTDYIIKIDPKDGKIVGRADLGDLRNRLGIKPMQLNVTGTDPDVLNGIAYDSVSNRIFVTGKYWPKVAEIKLDN